MEALKTADLGSQRDGGRARRAGPGPPPDGGAAGMSFSDPEPWEGLPRRSPPPELAEGEAEDRRGPEARLPMSLLRPPAAESSPRASGVDPEETAEPQASLESQELGIPASPTVPWPRRLESPTSSRFAALRAAAASGVPLDPAAELPDWRHEPRSTDWGSLAALRSGLVRVEARWGGSGRESRHGDARMGCKNTINSTIV